jgi:uncharacterized protein (DUF3820 family)
MPFGQFKGRRLLDLPESYLVWFQRNGWPQGKLGRQLALALEIKHNGLVEVVRQAARRGRDGEI